MQDNPDIRWIQRFRNFSRALESLRQGVHLAQERGLSDLEKQGLIQAFGFTHELAWNVLKDFLEEQGISGLIGSRDAAREAFRNELITDGQVWMDMIKARNLTLHTYNAAVAEAITRDIAERFFSAFEIPEKRFHELQGQAGESV